VSERELQSLRNLYANPKRHFAKSETFPNRRGLQREIRNNFREQAGFSNLPHASPGFSNLPHASTGFSNLPHASPGFSNLPQREIRKFFLVEFLQAPLVSCKNSRASLKRLIAECRARAQSPRWRSSPPSRYQQLLASQAWARKARGTGSPLRARAAAQGPVGRTAYLCPRRNRRPTVT
jgi:hypothetical protein